MTGGGGYIGTTLVPHLLRNNYEVIVLDRFFFGQELLEKYSDLGILRLIRDDIRWTGGEIFKGVDAVIDMAALSNDPAGEIDPWKTIEINYLGRSRIARLAKEAGVGRYLLISSCSIYGFQDGMISETSKTNPLTTYARANMLAERDNLGLGDSIFSSTVIRFATVYGLSGRMRFDLAINGMVLGALKTGKIPVMRDGTQWRPFIYVGDAARAIQLVIETEQSKINKEIFNVGSDNQNFMIKDLAELVAGSISSGKRPDIEWYGSPDKRSYRVSFEKARRVLGYESITTPDLATRELEKAITSGDMTDSMKTRTLDWYRHLLTDSEASKQVSLRANVVL